VIKTFHDAETEALYKRQQSLKFQSIERVARRKLIMLNNAQSLDDLRAVPGNKLEKLEHDRKGQHSIRINDQWRVCFRWDPAGKDAYDAEITDYH
jgi:proteic killer suppression protein